MPWDSTPVLFCLLAAQLLGLRLACPYFASAGLGAVAGVLMAVAFCGVLLCATLLVRNIFLIRCLLLPAILVGRFVDGERERQVFCEGRNPVDVQRIRIPSKDGAELDTTLLRLPETNTNERWIVWFNANGVIYEQVLPFLAEYGAQLHANVLAFNFRGVSKSSGYPLRASDLYADGEAVLQYLIARGVKLHNVILHGHSLGGAVAAELMRRHPECTLVSDRSFSSLSVTVQSVVKRGLGPMMGILLCGVLAFSHMMVVRFAGESAPDLWKSELSFFSYCLISLGLGYVIGVTDFIPNVAPHVISVFGWEMDSATALIDAPSRGLVLFHEYDAMITYNDCSMHYHLSQRSVPVASMKLQSGGANTHMYMLNSDPTEFSMFVEQVRRLISRQPES